MAYGHTPPGWRPETPLPARPASMMLVAPSPFHPPVGYRHSQAEDPFQPPHPRSLGLCYTGYELGTPGEAGEATIPGFVTPGTNYELGTPGEAGEAAIPGFCYTGYELGTPGEAGEAAIPRRRGVCLPRPRLRDIPPRARSHAF